MSKNIWIYDANIKSRDNYPAILYLSSIQIGKLHPNLRNI
ncbi:hypothetical protein CLOSBL3_10800 [Clostridiaceae bacterium BL-3]|nr:hypothetical protein CLOSBL3_10800 [Clostridiaceae bacterium BL-3]